MECKSKWAFHQARKNIELIDTLWNVNHLNLPHLSVSGGELIDTLWNVNMYFLMPPCLEQEN